MIHVVLSLVLSVVGFILGLEYAKKSEKAACDTRVAQVETNAENFYKVEANALAMRYQNDEARMIERFNATLKTNNELYQKRLEMLAVPWLKQRSGGGNSNIVWRDGEYAIDGQKVRP